MERKVSGRLAAKLMTFMRLALLILTCHPALGVTVATDASISETLNTPNGSVTIIRREGCRDLVVNGKTFTEVVHPPESMPAVDSKEEQRGYIVYSRATSDGVLPNSRPRRDEVTETLSTSIAPDETHHVQFTIFALRDLGNVAVSVGDLVSKSGARISSERVIVRPVRFRYVSNYWELKYSEIPRILDRPGVPTMINEESNQTFWVTIRIPENAVPGKYSGKIRVTPCSGKPTDIRLAVDVLPIRLDPAMWWGIYYYNATTDNPNVERDFADMRSHGVNALLYCPHPPQGLPPFTLKNGAVEVDFTHADRMFGLIKKYGFRAPVPYYPRLTSCRVLDIMKKAGQSSLYYGEKSVFIQEQDYPEDAKLVMADVFRQMVRHAKSAGWPEVLWYLVDEPNDPTSQEYQWALLEYATMRQVDPAARTFCTAYAPDIIKALSPTVDSFAVDLWNLTGSSSLAKEIQKNGKTVYGSRWICQHDEYWWARSVAGFIPEKLGLNGMTEWTYYGASNTLSDPYADMRNGQSGKDISYSCVSPEDGSLLPTIVWEAVQEGIDDSRYVRTLTRLIAVASQSKNAKAKVAAASAQKTLDEVVGPQDRGNEWWSEPNINLVRRRIVDETLRLNSALEMVKAL